MQLNASRMSSTEINRHIAFEVMLANKRRKLNDALKGSRKPFYCVKLLVWNAFAITYNVWVSIEEFLDTEVAIFND